ncbi:MAG: VOC family protein [Candidatus Gracilibacteria bacterium]
MQIKLTSVMVDDQEKALKFYTEVLGFIKKRDIPVGKHKYLTVVSPDGPQEIELLLESNNNEAAKVFQKAIFEQKIPLTAFFVDNLAQEHARMKDLGVNFVMEPTTMFWGSMAIFDDTCGNLIQLNQVDIEV